MVSTVLFSLVISAAVSITVAVVVPILTMSSPPLGLTTILLSCSGMTGVPVALMTEALTLLLNFDFGLA